jgi:hypothetical protein
MQQIAPFAPFRKIFWGLVPPPPQICPRHIQRVKFKTEWKESSRDTAVPGPFLVVFVRRRTHISVERMLFVRTFLRISIMLISTRTTPGPAALHSHSRPRLLFLLPSGLTYCIFKTQSQSHPTVIFCSSCGMSSLLRTYDRSGTILPPECVHTELMEEDGKGGSRSVTMPDPHCMQLTAPKQFHTPVPSTCLTRVTLKVVEKSLSKLPFNQPHAPPNHMNLTISVCESALPLGITQGLSGW